MVTVFTTTRRGLDSRSHHIRRAVHSTKLILCAAATFLFLTNDSRAQFGGIKDALKQTGEDVSNKLNKVGGDISREGKQAINDAGQLVQKPFRHAADNVKEAIFFGMRDHVVAKNRQLGIRGVRFKKGSRYYDAIQPHLNNEFDFSEITFYFNAYVPHGQAGITFGNEVFLDIEDTGDRFTLGLIAHETGHVIQYRKLELKGFARAYIDDTCGSFLKAPTTDDVKIHDSLKLEREADDFENRVLAASNKPTSSSDVEVIEIPRRRTKQDKPGSSGSQQQESRSDGEVIAGIILGSVKEAIENEQLRRQQKGSLEPPRNQSTFRPNQQKRVDSPRLGVNVQTIAGRGAIIRSISAGLPAQRAGLEINDIVVSIDGRRVESAEDILTALRGVAQQGRRSAVVVVENHRLDHLPQDERYQEVEVSW